MTAFLLQQLVNALTIGAIYALIALGYTMVYGVLQLLNFAHGALFMLGAYVAFYLMASAVGPVGGTIGIIGLTVLYFGTFAIVGALGVGIERVAYKPLRDSSRLAPMLSALGMDIILRNAVQVLVGPQPIAFPPLIDRAPHDVGGVYFNDLNIEIFIGAVLLMVLLHLFVNRTRLGIQVRAVSESRLISQLLGVNIDRAISIIFFIGPGLGAVAGIMYSSYYGVMTFSMGIIMGIKAFTAAILGGIGSIPGAMLGGFILGIIETFGAGFLPLLSGGAIGSEYRDIFAFAILIIVLIFKPAGIFGEAVTEEATVYKRDF